jgi:hypothetical protein
MEKASTDLNRAGTSAKETDKSLDSLARNTKILAGIEIGRLFVDGLQSLGNVFRDIAGRVTSLVSSVNDSINTLDDFSQRTGIGVEALQGYALAAKLAGVDTEQFGSAIQKLSVTIGKATPGDALDKSLKEINLSLEQLRALSPDQQFSAIGAAISELPTVAGRAAAAVEIFGKQGAALAPLFREGAASIEELQARAKRLGIIISDTQVNNVTAMNDGFDLVLTSPNGRYLNDKLASEAIAGMWSEIGVRTTVQVMDWSPFVEGVLGKTHDAFFFQQVGVLLDATVSINFHSGKKGAAWQGYDNATANQLIDDAPKTLDAAARNDLYKQLGQLIYDECPWVFLWNQQGLFGVRQEVEDWAPHQDGVIRLGGMRLAA